MTGDMEQLQREVAELNRRLKTVEEFVVHQRPIVNGERIHSERDAHYARGFVAFPTPFRANENGAAS
ncbi:MAG: hypothetical protein JWR07_1927 [Nevskia sp.]|nr:hypothetical protein [Nevskia sp.]